MSYEVLRNTTVIIIKKCDIIATNKSVKHNGELRNITLLIWEFNIQ